MTSLTVMWKSTCSLFFIKAPDHLSILNRDLFLAGDVRLHEASFKKTLELLWELPKCEVSLWDLPFLPETFVFKQKLDFHETRNMQFKDYSSSSKTAAKKISDEKYDIRTLCRIRGFLCLSADATSWSMESKRSRFSPIMFFLLYSR